MSTRRVVAAGVAAISLLVPFVPAGGQTAATITETGWWTRRPGATAQPSGGFEVAESPDDDLSIAALRVTTTAPLTEARLVMNETGGVRQDAASLRVCVTASAWNVANPGAYAQRPIPNCGGGGLTVTRNPTGGAWSADVLPLLPPDGGTVSLMIVPGPPPSLPVDGFQVVFAGASIAAQAAPEDDEEDLGGGSGFSGGSTPTASDGFGFGFGGGVDTPLPFPPETTTPAADDEALGEEADGDDETALPTRPRAARDSDGGQPWGRLPGLVVAAAAIGAVTATVRRFLRDSGLLPLQ